MARANPLAEYFKAISEVSLLSQEEEAALFRRLERGDTRARNLLMMANQGLVVKVATQHTGRGLPLEDLIGEGNLGLIRAIEKFDLAKGFRFSSYAIHWISQAVRRAAMEKVHLVRPPVELTGKMRQYRQAVSELRRALGRGPDHKEIANALGVDEGEVGRLEKAERALYRVGRFPDFEFRDPSQQKPLLDEPWLAAESRIEAQDTVETLLSVVTDREREVIRLCYGLHNGRAWTLHEVGQKINVTKARVGQIRDRAMSKMRAIAAQREGA